MCQPVTIGWINNNMGGHYKRSVSAAMMIGFGNAGGIVASNVFITEEAPAYKTGYGTSLGLLWLCAICCTVFLIGVMFENGKRERGERDHRLSGEDSDNLGDGELDIDSLVTAVLHQLKSVPSRSSTFPVHLLTLQPSCTT